MQIEAGKTYRTRGGNQADIREVRVGEVKGFVDGCRYTWSAGGLFDSAEAHEHDLIAEWVDEPTEDKHKTWGEMTDAEKGALLLAHHEGEPIQYKIFPREDRDYPWQDNKDPMFNDVHAYRIRKEPVRGTTVRYGRARDFLSFEPDARDSCRLHFPTLDGELIPGTYTNGAGDVIVVEDIGDE